MVRLGGLAGIAGCVLWLAPASLGAQGIVSGRVTLLERPGQTSKDLANAVIFLDAGPGRGPAPGTATVTVAMHGREFLPHVTVMTVGSGLRFQNQDPFRHNAFSNSMAGAFDFGLADRGTTSEHELPHVGVYPVFCDIHSKMSAFIVVVGTPLYAQAGVDGRFAIADVPAGSYTLHVWHERAGETMQPITVGAHGMTNVSVALDVRGFHRADHKNKSGEDYYSTTEAERY